MWEKIENILNEKGLSEKEFYRKFSHSGQEMLRRIKAGTATNPPYVRICEITKILGVTTDDIRPDDF